MDRAIRSIGAWLVAATLLLAFTASAAYAAEPPAAPQYTETLLSNERDTSRWAFVVSRTIAYSEPRHQGHKVRRLTTKTPDGTNELVLTLRERMYDDGTAWVQVRLPMRGHGRTGWVRRGALDNYKVIHTQLEISRNRFVALLRKNGKIIWRARIGVGKRGTHTPSGNFYVRDRLITTNPRGLYGPYAFGLSAYSSTLTDWPGGGIVGIHGTNKPGLIPGRISHGCIRVRNNKIRKLYRLMPAGTPVTIN